MSFNRQAASSSGDRPAGRHPRPAQRPHQQRTCDLSGIEVTAIDEADRMADMGFLPQVRAILDLTPADGSGCCSPRRSTARSRRWSPLPARPGHPRGGLGHGAGRDDGPPLLVIDTAPSRGSWRRSPPGTGRTILFVRTKHGVDRLVKTLRREGVAAGALHGGKAQNARNRAIAEFKEGRTPVLVATDVAARGIHIDDVSLVVHVDPPADPKDYLHRAGRTARAGESGTVVTMVTQPERREVDRLTRSPGCAPPSPRSAPVMRRSPGSPVPGRRAVCRWPRPASRRPTAPPPGRPTRGRGRSGAAPPARRAPGAPPELSASARRPLRAATPQEGAFPRPARPPRTGPVSSGPAPTAPAGRPRRRRLGDRQRRRDVEVRRQAVVTAPAAARAVRPASGRRVQPLQPGRGASRASGSKSHGRAHGRSMSNSRSTGGG
jgi:hypothetical protein